MSRPFVWIWAIAVFILSTHVSAGVWRSGGGLLVKDSQNPWFLTNTKVVKWCLKIDESNFGVSQDRAKSGVKRAIKFWQKQLAPPPPHPDIMPTPRADVGTQVFKYHACDEDTDVTFLFGVLSDKQMVYLKRPTEIVGITVRTDYDLKNLKGRGFIYIAPQKGALRPEGDYVVSKLWSRRDGHFLDLALMHELGHVFGVGHVGESLMRATYLEELVTELNEPYILAEGNPTVFKYVPQKYDGFAPCLGPRFRQKTMYQFFGIDFDHDCVRIKVSKTHLKVFSEEEKSAKKWTFVGQAPLDQQGGKLESRAILKVYMSDAQTVHPIMGSGFWFPWPQALIQNRLGVYKSVDGQVSRQVFALLDPNIKFPRIGGIFDGQLISDLTEPFMLSEP